MSHKEIVMFGLAFKKSPNKMLGLKWMVVGFLKPQTRAEFNKEIDTALSVKGRF